MNLNEILSKFEYAANNPKKLMQEYISDGNKVIGCLPVYTPAEIVHASGMIPMGIWGGNVAHEISKQYFPAFACSIMQCIFEYGAKGSYDGMSGVIIPCMCDTLICMTQNWKSGIKNIPMIPMVYPQQRKIDAGKEFLIEELKVVKSKLEGICGHEIKDIDINNSIEVFNENRRALQEFVELVPDYLNTITPYFRNMVIKSSHFMKKEEHTELLKQLNEELRSMKKEDYKGSKILVSGITFDSKEILDVLKDNNIAIAYDDLAQESRQFRTLVPDAACPLARLAEQWADIDGCSLAYDPYKNRGKLIVEKAKKMNLDGVIYALMKFCDPEEYDYPIVKKDIENADIPHLYIEIEQNSTNIEQIRTRIQTFADIIS